jgi:hypothetical protein
VTLKFGVIALARTTFDMEFAEEMKNQAFAALDAAGIATVGPRPRLQRSLRTAISISFSSCRLPSPTRR